MGMDLQDGVKCAAKAVGMHVSFIVALSHAQSLTDCYAVVMC